jgi:pimeloyl-ACP methyl ester carboxylesterase
LLLPVLTLVVAACQTTASPSAVAPTIPLPSRTPAATTAPTAAPTAPPSATTAPTQAATNPPASAAGSTVPSASAPGPTATSGAGASQPTGAGLDWQPCGDAVECATLQVPLDHANPGADSIEIALVRMPASGERIGSLLVNPGGPGASGVDFVRDNATAVFSGDLLERFDIVGFDPRGVGASTPIECVDDATLDRLNANDPTPDDAAEREALIEGAKEFVDACERQSGNLLPYMTTEDAARDMEEIRKALGEDQLSYLGFSYGTFLGAEYANLFPERVRAFVLDGAVDPTQGFVESLETQGKGFADALERFLDNCDGRSTCVFNGGRNVRETFDQVMASIDARPLPAEAIGDPRLVGPGEAFTGVLAALYDQGSWNILEQGLELARRGDGSLLLLLADSYNRRDPDGHYENISAANNAVNCSDYVVPTRIEDYDALVPRLKQIAPRFGEAIAYSGLTCAFWPVHPTADPEPTVASGAPPILVVGTTGDPATPYAWAEKLSSTLESGSLLTYQGEGHTAYGGKSRCIDDAVDQYLISLTVPAEGTRCS